VALNNMSKTTKAGALPTPTKASQRASETSFPAAASWSAL
jgi:hypothetical protein